MTVHPRNKVVPKQWVFNCGTRPQGSVSFRAYSEQQITGLRSPNQISQQLHDQTIPGLNEQAAMGGGLNRSRAGMAEGLANQSAALAMGNADSQIQNNAFNTGVCKTGR